MKSIVVGIVIFWTALAYAGDLPDYEFRIGDWDFKLGSVGGEHGDLTRLEGTHRPTKVSSMAHLDYRWFGYLVVPLKKGEKVEPGLLDLLVNFAGPHWETRPEKPDIYEVLRQYPPTQAYRNNFRYVTSDESLEAMVKKHRQLKEAAPRSEPEKK